MISGITVLSERQRPVLPRGANEVSSRWRLTVKSKTIDITEPLNDPQTWKSGMFTFSEEGADGAGFIYNCKSEEKELSKTAAPIHSTSRLSRKDVEMSSTNSIAFDPPTLLEKLPFWTFLQQSFCFISGNWFGKIIALCVFAPEFP
jgi:hypothetical protein